MAKTHVRWWGEVGVRSSFALFGGVAGLAERRVEFRQPPRVLVVRGFEQGAGRFFASYRGGGREDRRRGHHRRR